MKNNIRLISSHTKYHKYSSMREVKFITKTKADSLIFVRLSFKQFSMVLRGDRLNFVNTIAPSRPDFENKALYIPIE